MLPPEEGPQPRRRPFLRIGRGECWRRERVAARSGTGATGWMFRRSGLALRRQDRTCRRAGAGIAWRAHRAGGSLSGDEKPVSVLLNAGGTLRAHARLRPATTGVRDLERALAYAQWNARACRLANALLGLGLRKGDRVAVLSFSPANRARALPCQRGLSGVAAVHPGAPAINPGRPAAARRRPLSRVQVAASAGAPRCS